MHLVMGNYIKLVMEQKWFIISQMDQTQLIEFKRWHIIQILLILVVVIILVQGMCSKIFSESSILEQAKTYNKHFIMNIDMTAAKYLDAIGTENCTEIEHNAIGIGYKWSQIEYNYIGIKSNVNKEKRYMEVMLKKLCIGTENCIEIEFDIIGIAYKFGQIEHAFTEITGDDMILGNVNKQQRFIWKDIKKHVNIDILSNDIHI